MCTLKSVRFWAVVPPVKNLVEDAHQVRNCLDHAPDRRRIFALDNLVQAGEAQSLDYPAMLVRSRVLRTEVLNADRCLDICHFYSSCTVFPRIAATSARSRSCTSA